MSRYGLFAIGFCLLVGSALAQSGAAPAANVQNEDQKALLQQKLNSEFKLTKATADRSDIVTAGSVLVLQKDGLLMCDTTAAAPPTSTYKNGKISMGFGAGWTWAAAAGDTTKIAQRKFVAGEKFWITGFTIQDDGVLFDFYSDPYQDTRYYGRLKFPYPKHTMPPADEMLKSIAEAISVQGDTGAAANPAPAAPTPVSQTTMAPIPPPPPPPDAPPPQPKTISIGETREQVVAILGQPQKVAQMGTKEIDYYPDMKVIFVHGKVSDVQ